jgi:hypothetical protein
MLLILFLCYSVAVAAAPAVSITDPSSGTSYTNAKTVTITALVSGKFKTSKVEFYDGSTLKGTDTSDPYTYAWSITSANNGTHSWTAKAYNATGKTLTSSAVILTVNINTPAPNGSVTINNNDTYTKSPSVTLTLSASDADGVSQMCISNTASCSSWEAYATTKAWTLTSGDGTKTVRVWYKDNAGNANTTPYSDSIILDTTPPSSSILINNGNAYTKTIPVTLTLSATDAASGVSQMCISNTASCSSWEAYATTKAWTLTSGDGTKTVRVWYKDNAGNATPTTTPYSDTIILDTSAPQPVTGLTATAISSSQINLTWSPSFDTGPSGLAGYKVYRLPATNPIGTTTATNYSNTGLLANTQYCYQVASYDNAGNNSAKCTQVCATTQGSQQGSGETLWAERFGGTAEDVGQAVAVDSSGNILVAGYFQGTAVFGDVSLTSAGVKDIFLAKYSPLGEYIWAKRIGGTGTDLAYSIAVDGSGNVAVTGLFQNSVDFGGGSLTSAGSSDVFLVKYSGAGVFKWARRMGSFDSDYGYGVTIDGSGNVAVTGYFRGTVDFGGGLLSSVGYSDIFVAKYKGLDGLHMWSKSFGTTGYDQGRGVSADAAGNVIITGYFGDMGAGSIDFGGGPLSNVGGSDIFVAKLSAADGSHIWSRGCGGSYSDRSFGISKVDASGNVIITGSFEVYADFGGGIVIGSSDQIDIFVVKYDGADGSYIWARHFGNGASDAAYAVDADSNGNAAVTGYFLDSVDFDTGILTSAGNADIFLINLAP